MNVTSATIISVLLVSLVSLVGAFFLSLKKKTLHAIILELVGFSIGALFGGVFIHILPEVSTELGFSTGVSLLILLGILVGFVIEKFVHWHHCHGDHCEHGGHGKLKPHGVLNLVGDGVHNFIDGILIAAAYIVSLPVGLATTLAVLLHEIPQEIGDFAVLIHAGWKRSKALLANFLSALTALLGAILTLIIGPFFEKSVPYILPFAAGMFLYVASTDLIPELHKETKPIRSVAQLLAILAGVGVMALLLLL